MLTIQISLNSSSYGACPWNRAQIEGVIEKIPSVTRILRAILYGAFVSGVGESSSIKLLLEKLAFSLPFYYIPEGTYVSLQKYRLDQTGTSTLYQSGKMLSEPYFRYKSGEYFLVGWEGLNLNADELSLLENCLRHCHYLGRSEHLTTWKIIKELPRNFNCFPSKLGSEVVQCVDAKVVDSLYLAPGVRNSQLKSSNFPGFYQATYKIERTALAITAINEPIFDTVIVATDKLLPACMAIYWCDLFHKALVKKSPETKIFMDGSLRITPIYTGDSFKKISLYCRKGFSPNSFRQIVGVDQLYGRSTINLLIADTYESTPTTEKMLWASHSPFFLPLQPSLKFSRNGRVRNTGYRLLAGTDFVRNGATHQALKFFLIHCGIEEKKICYQEAEGQLLALLNEQQIASCLADEWLNYGEWQVKRFSGTKLSFVEPMTPVGYRVSILSSLSIRGALSIGYGKNFGLGVLCGKSAFAPLNHPRFLGYRGELLKIDV